MCSPQGHLAPNDALRYLLYRLVSNWRVLSLLSALESTPFFVEILGDFDKLSLYSFP